MKKTIAIFLGFWALAFSALADELPSIRLGADFSLPYTLMVNGDGSRNRTNTNLGLDGRYFLTENFSLGGRVSLDVERKTGSSRQFILMPGILYRWLPGVRFEPYLRFDLPVILRGAFNQTGSSSDMDMGLAGGAGVLWNLGGAIGVPNTSIRADFSIFYLFGLGDAVNVLALDLIRLGVDYSF